MSTHDDGGLLKLHGVSLTFDQWAATNEFPHWELNPPQRENYADDHQYALGVRDYADRVLAARNRKEDGQK